jgi:hypothetical protein
MQTLDEVSKQYDTRHGGPFDRGAADSYYNRPSIPHYFVGGTNTSDKVTVDGMTQDEVNAYYAGYEWNEALGSKKSWD